MIKKNLAKIVLVIALVINPCYMISKGGVGGGGGHFSGGHMGGFSGGAFGAGHSYSSAGIGARGYYSTPGMSSGRTAIAAPSGTRISRVSGSRAGSRVARSGERRGGRDIHHHHHYYGAYGPWWLDEGPWWDDWYYGYYPYDLDDEDYDDEYPIVYVNDENEDEED